MSLLADLGAVPVAALAAEPLLSRDGTSGSRTVMGAVITLVVIAVVITVGLVMSRGQRA
jgi:hypothetical protein